MENQPTGVDMSTPTPTSTSAQVSPDDTVLASTPKKPKNKNLIIGCSVAAGAVAIALIAVAVILNLPKDNCGQTNCITSSADVTTDEEQTDEEPIVVLENTTLSAGSYTTTIGGKSVTYKAAYLVDGIDATIGSGTYTSSADDEVTFLVVNGGSLTIQGEDISIIKTGSDSFERRGDDYSFYGKNSAVVVVGEDSSVSIKGTTITTSVSGANAVVATNYGQATVLDTTINTSKDNSRGLHATYQGAISADGVTIVTEGGSCAALATDRGEGTVAATNMTLSTAGAGSPLIYSTGNISVSNSTGTAAGAQIAVVEGKNSVTIADSNLSANGNGNRNGVDNAGVMIYQSMSGDADTGVGSFTARNSQFTVLSTSSVYQQTPFFFVTNTTAEISLTNVEINFYEDGYFVLAAGTSEWGRSGSNGGTVTVTSGNLTATNTNIGVDEISSVTGI